jgi:hypothetical protein
MKAYNVYFLRLYECLISENSENILIKFGMGIYIKRCREKLFFFVNVIRARLYTTINSNVDFLKNNSWNYNTNLNFTRIYYKTLIGDVLMAVY